MTRHNKAIEKHLGEGLFLHPPQTNARGLYLHPPATSRGHKKNVNYLINYINK